MDVDFTTEQFSIFHASLHLILHDVLEVGEALSDHTWIEELLGEFHQGRLEVSQYELGFQLELMSCSPEVSEGKLKVQL